MGDSKLHLDFNYLETLVFVYELICIVIVALIYGYADTNRKRRSDVTVIECYMNNMMPQRKKQTWRLGKYREQVEDLNGGLPKTCKCTKVLVMLMLSPLQGWQSSFIKIKDAYTFSKNWKTSFFMVLVDPITT